MMFPALSIAVVIIVAAMATRVAERLVDWLIPAELNRKLAALVARLCLRIANTEPARHEAQDVLAEICAYDPRERVVKPLAAVLPVLVRSVKTRAPLERRPRVFYRRHVEPFIVLAVAGAVGATQYNRLFGIASTVIAMALLVTCCGRLMFRHWAVRPARRSLVAETLICAATLAVAVSWFLWPLAAWWYLGVYTGAWIMFGLAEVQIALSLERARVKRGTPRVAAARIGGVQLRRLVAGGREDYPILLMLHQLLSAKRHRVSPFAVMIVSLLRVMIVFVLLYAVINAALQS